MACEQQLFKEEWNECSNQLLNILEQLKEQVDHVQSETEVDTVVNVGGQDFPTPGTSKVGNLGMNKSPQLPVFSGTDPVPKDEASYEQWGLILKNL